MVYLNHHSDQCFLFYFSMPNYLLSLIRFYIWEETTQRHMKGFFNLSLLIQNLHIQFLIFNALLIVI